MNVENESNKIDRLGDIQDGLEYLINERNVSIYKLMNDNFIRANTDFETLKNFLETAGVKDEKDFESPSFNHFVKSHTHFDDWEEMLIQAGNQYANRHLDD